jgi:hypothetical protein
MQEDLIQESKITQNDSQNLSPGHPSEITVILKDSEKTLKQQYLIYDPYEVSIADQTIRNCILETKKSFEGVPESIKVKITLQVT